MDKLTTQEMEFVIQAVANTSIQAKDSLFVSAVLQKLGQTYEGMAKPEEDKKQKGNSSSKVDSKQASA